MTQTLTEAEIANNAVAMFDASDFRSATGGLGTSVTVGNYTAAVDASGNLTLRTLNGTSQLIGTSEYMSSGAISVNGVSKNVGTTPVVIEATATQTKVFRTFLVDFSSKTIVQMSLSGFYPTPGGTLSLRVTRV